MKARLCCCFGIWIQNFLFKSLYKEKLSTSSFRESCSSSEVCHHDRLPVSITCARSAISAVTPVIFHDIIFILFLSSLPSYFGKISRFSKTWIDKPGASDAHSVVVEPVVSPPLVLSSQQAWLFASCAPGSLCNSFCRIQHHNQVVGRTVNCPHSWNRFI